MESITFGVEIEILVRPKLEEADLAQEFEAEGWNKEQSLSNRNVEPTSLLRQILVSKHSPVGMLNHPKNQSYERCGPWTESRALQSLRRVMARGLLVR